MRQWLLEERMLCHRIQGKCSPGVEQLDCKPFQWSRVYLQVHDERVGEEVVEERCFV